MLYFQTGQVPRAPFILATVHCPINSGPLRGNRRESAQDLFRAEAKAVRWKLCWYRKSFAFGWIAKI